MAAPSDHIFIGELPPDIDEVKFKQNFEAYGTIQSFKLFPPGPNGKKRALVHLATVDEAVWLVENLHGNVPLGLETEVTVHYQPKQAAGAGGMMGAGPYSGGGKGCAGGMMNQAGMMQQGGCGMMQGGMMQGGMMQGGIKPGFGGMAGQQVANGTVVNQFGVVTRTGGQAGGNGVCGFDSVWQGLLRNRIVPGTLPTNDERTVIITGLPSDTTEHDVLKMLSPFGAVAPNSIKLPLNPDGSSKGMGQGTFMNLEESKKAAQALNNCVLPDHSIMRARNNFKFQPNANKGFGQFTAPVQGLMPGQAGPKPQ